MSAEAWAPRLTNKQARAALAALDIPLDDRDVITSCPVCYKLMALTLDSDAAGNAKPRCSTGCPELVILGALIAVHNRAALPADPLNRLRAVMRLQTLDEIRKLGKDGAAYELRCADGRIITIPGGAGLHSQALFRQVFLPQVRHLPERCKQPEWDRVVETIESLATEYDTVSSEAEETRGWLAGYIVEARKVDMEDVTTLYDLLEPRAGVPLLDTEGRLHVRLGDMGTRLWREIGLRVSARELSTRLASLEFEREQLAARRGSHTRKGRFWRSPTGFEVDA